MAGGPPAGPNPSQRSFTALWKRALMTPDSGMNALLWIPGQDPDDNGVVLVYEPPGHEVLIPAVKLHHASGGLGDGAAAEGFAEDPGMADRNPSRRVRRQAILAAPRKRLGAARAARGTVSPDDAHVDGDPIAVRRWDERRKGAPKIGSPLLHVKASLTLTSIDAEKIVGCVAQENALWGSPGLTSGRASPKTLLVVRADPGSLSRFDGAGRR